MNKIFIAILLALAFLFSSCASKATVVTKTKLDVVYPELPEIKPLPDMSLIPFRWDYPRDMSRLAPKSSKKCLETPDVERNGVYWETCGENPPMLNSNIFIGFDQDNFRKFEIYMKKIKARLIQYKERLRIINKQREKWREMNSGELQG